MAPMAGKFETFRSANPDNAVCTAREPAVFLALGSLESELAQLGAVADDLMGRLESVCRPPAPAVARPNEDGCCATCKLDDMIRSRTVTARVLREKLEDTLSRLEL